MFCTVLFISEDLFKYIVLSEDSCKRKMPFIVGTSLILDAESEIPFASLGGSTTKVLENQGDHPLFLILHNGKKK